MDKWIWSVRMVKSRTIATESCKGGKVSVNGESAKPSRTVRVGDMVEVRFRGFSKVYKVLKLIETRVSAKLAAECFEDHSPERLPQARPPKRERGSGRPTKRERRALDRLRE